jgi:hypothetical protein
MRDKPEWYKILKDILTDKKECVIVSEHWVTNWVTLSLDEGYEIPYSVIMSFTELMESYDVFIEVLPFWRTSCRHDGVLVKPYLAIKVSWGT